jgi:molybdopterin molybdotransferase
MITVNDAEQLIMSRLLALGPQKIPLSKAHGSALREALIADRDYPPFDRVAMDGYALSFATWHAGIRRFRVEGLQTAGQPPHSRKAPDGAIEIMTGAKLPEGCDFVVRYEDTRRTESFMEVIEDVEALPFANVHRRGSDASSGARFEDARVNPPLAALAASFGYASIEVARKARIQILGLGDELVSIDSDPTDYQIRESNVHAVGMALRARGYDVDIKVLRDEPNRIRSHIEAALECKDVLLLSGGVSAGKTDFVPTLLLELGVTKIFHKVLQRPGKPLWFGRLGSGPAVFGLPGNPVSTLICLYRYVLPFLKASELGHTCANQSPYAELLGAMPKPRKLTHFVPVRLEWTKDARVHARKAEHNGSGDFISLHDTDGFVEVPGESEPSFDPEQKYFRYYGWDAC